VFQRNTLWEENSWLLMKRSIGTHDAYDKNDYRTKRSDGTLQTFIIIVLPMRPAYRQASIPTGQELCSIIAE